MLRDEARRNGVAHDSLGHDLQPNRIPHGALALSFLIRVSLILLAVFLSLRLTDQFWFELPRIVFIVMVYISFPAVVCLILGIYYWVDSRREPLRESIITGLELSVIYSLMLFFFFIILTSEVQTRGIAPLALSYTYLGELFGILAVFGAMGALGLREKSKWL